MNPRSSTIEALPLLAVSLLIHVLGFWLVDWIKPDCGDGIVQLTEECDDGNELPLDGCSPKCTLEPVCGDAVIEGEEECDDGNRLNGDGCNADCVLELEIRDVEPPPEEPEPEEPEPEPEPEEVEPPPPPEPEEPPPPPPKKKKKEPEPPPPPPDAPPPPPAIELPADQTITGGGSGVTVIGGTQSRAGKAGGTKEGKKGGKKKGEGKTPGGQGDAPSPVPTGPKWAPKGALYIAQLPSKVRDVKIECPAVKEMGISGKVVLRIQVRSNGSVRSVKVVKKMGHGCDAIAVKAIKKMKWKPAIGTDGKAADYVITSYKYEFEAPR